MPNKRNFVVYDLETTGLSPEKGAEIVQIGAMALKYGDYGIHEIGSFEITVKPLSPEKADDQAIRVIGNDLWNKALNEGVHPKTALRKFHRYITDANWSGKYWSAPVRVGFNNNSFDDKFLEYWMKEYKVIGQKKDDQPWAHFSLDVYPLMFSVFGRDNLKNNKLDTFAEMLGMSRSSSTHDAMEDVMITVKMFQRYMNFSNFQIRPKISIKKENKDVV
jgi:DNA polymerase III epsilon subunit-like protein